MSSALPECNTKRRNLILRVASSIVLVPVVLALVWFGNEVYAAAVVGVMVLAYREWVRLTGDHLPLQTKTVGLVLLVFLLILASAGLYGLALCLGAATSVYLYLSARRAGGDLWFALCLPYVGGAGLALLALRDELLGGRGAVFYLLATVWATDIGGFLAGRTIGGPKLCPKISPNKTWAGLVGGMVLASFAAWGFEGTPLGGWMGGDTMQPVVLASFLAVVAQAGDFFESAAKRRAGCKDSGTLIPGHGGVLDRIDGLLFAAPALALLLVGKVAFAL